MSEIDIESLEMRCEQPGRQWLVEGVWVKRTQSKRQGRYWWWVDWRDGTTSESVPTFKDALRLVVDAINGVTPSGSRPEETG